MLTLIRNIKNDNNDPRENVTLPITLINNFNSTFPRTDWNYATTYETDKIIKSLKTKNSYGYDETSQEF